MRHPNRRTLVKTLAVTVLLVLATATPAAAHPFIRGGEAPVDSLATLTLAMAHGCGTEQAGGGDPTLQVAMEIPEELRIVEVPPEGGWDVAFETDDDGAVAVVVWTAESAQEPAPDFVFDGVFSGQPGDEMYLRVFQKCDEFAYRWIGTPDEPATDPAIRVRLTEADATNPPPSEEASPVEEETNDAGTQAAEEPAPDELMKMPEGSEPEEGAEAQDPVVADEQDASDDLPVNEGLGGVIWLIGAAVFVLAGIGWAVLRKR